jgi:hypothetical protein
MADAPGRQNGSPSPVQYLPAAHALSPHCLKVFVNVDCGYPASALKERVYAHPSVQGGMIDRCGLLIYAASAGAQGTLGGLISIATRFSEILAAGLRRAKGASTIPLGLRLCEDPTAK